MSGKLSKFKETILGRQFGFLPVLGLMIGLAVFAYIAHGIILNEWLIPAVTVHLLPAMETAAAYPPPIGWIAAWMLTFSWDKVFVAFIMLWIGFFGGVLITMKRTQKEEINEPTPEKIVEPEPPAKTQSDTDAKIAELTKQVEALKKAKAAE